uniref:Uncharacterized protein n=1 Tax=Rhizophora mucronata TaxID=61149 RepID=A0A2P2QBD6_RHIMU
MMKIAQLYYIMHIFSPFGIFLGNEHKAPMPSIPPKLS